MRRVDPVDQVELRYRGLAKNGNRLFVVAALANLFIVRRPLLDGLRG